MNLSKPELDTALADHPELASKLLGIIQKTYDEHALGNRPWGVDPTLESAGGCSYAAGCAIGISLTPEIARLCDNQPNGYIASIFRDHDAAGVLALELFGSRESVPEAVVQVLNELQNVHDTIAKAEDDGEDIGDPREAYREELVKLSEIWGLKPPKGDPCPSAVPSPTE